MKDQYLFHECKRYAIWSIEYFAIDADSPEQAKELFLQAVKEGNQEQYSQNDFELFAGDIEQIEGHEIYDSNSNLIYKEA